METVFWGYVKLLTCKKQEASVQVAKWNFSPRWISSLFWSKLAFFLGAKWSSLNNIYSLKSQIIFCIYTYIALYVESKRRWYLHQIPWEVPFRKQLLERAFTVSMQMTETFSWRLSSASWFICLEPLRMHHTCMCVTCIFKSQGLLHYLIIIWACWGFKVFKFHSCPPSSLSTVFIHFKGFTHSLSTNSLLDE